MKFFDNLSAIGSLYSMSGPQLKFSIKFFMRVAAKNNGNALLS